MPVVNNGDNLPRIVEGRASVSIVHESGQTLAGRGAIEIDALGGLIHKLESDLSSGFCIKALSTSSGERVRLLFVVSYIVEGSGAFQDEILSRPFTIASNSKKEVFGMIVLS